MYLLDLLQMYRLDFQEFVYANKLIVLAASYSIGLVTNQLITKVLDQIVLPFLMFMIRFSYLKRFYEVLTEYISKTVLNGVLQLVGGLSWDIFVWLTTIALTFILLEYVLNRRIIGLKSNVTDDTKIDFLKSKAEAKGSFIPDQEQLLKMRVREEKDAHIIDKVKDKDIIDDKEKKKVTAEMEKFDLADYYKLAH